MYIFLHALYEVEEDEEMQEAENLCGDQGSFNVCELIDASVFGMIRFGSGPIDEGPNQPHRPNACMKQRSACTHHKKITG